MKSIAYPQLQGVLMSLALRKDWKRANCYRRFPFLAGVSVFPELL